MKILHEQESSSNHNQMKWISLWQISDKERLFWASAAVKNAADL